jgi:hypothetical protein
MTTENDGHGSLDRAEWNKQRFVNSSGAFIVQEAFAKLRKNEIASFG